MECLNCKRPLAREECVGSISGSIMGDEHTDTFYFCRACQAYTVESCWDNFTGTESVELRGPLAAAEGGDRIALIRQCATPWDKKCRCEAHRRYFNDTLD